LDCSASFKLFYNKIMVQPQYEIFHILHYKLYIPISDEAFLSSSVNNFVSLLSGVELLLAEIFFKNIYDYIYIFRKNNKKIYLYYFFFKFASLIFFLFFYLLDPMSALARDCCIENSNFQINYKHFIKRKEREEKSRLTLNHHCQYKS
jgi:hypothetical protein